jgi:hypothetical protein
MGHQPAPAPEKSSVTAAEKKSPPSVMGVPLAKWAITAISFIFVCYVALHFGMKGYGEYQKVKQDNAELAANAAKLKNQNSDLVTHNAALQQTNQDLTAQTQAKITCANHSQDPPGEGVTMRLPPGQAKSGVNVTLFKKDGCIHLVRDGAPGAYGIISTQDLWIPDPSTQQATFAFRNGHPSPRDAMDDPLKFSVSKLRPGNAGQMPLVVASFPPGSATLLPASYSLPKTGPQLTTVQHVEQNKCANPHPGSFTSKWGTPNGCIVPLYRTWKDGCQHSQLYNSCLGKWDKRINWMRCSGPPHR